ncbi:Shootin-1 [Liparis tanakae]|uniref:Shootin-1 n=1 Tax=Liparis tanakae TaxID=230148 RepID=A0A4Z2FJ72_9TELE|nr:Shootin-1 [Liparis tanakae]
MASEQLDKTAVITKLSNQGTFGSSGGVRLSARHRPAGDAHARARSSRSVARQEYEGLQRRHETAAMECKKLEQERDEAVKKLNEFQQGNRRVNSIVYVERFGALTSQLYTHVEQQADHGVGIATSLFQLPSQACFQTPPVLKRVGPPLRLSFKRFSLRGSNALQCDHFTEDRI